MVRGAAMKKKIKNPLRRRILRELLGDWRKYLVVFLFLVLTIGFVSGMYVANDSMLSSARAGESSYKLEYGHFELQKQADSALLSAIASGEKADVKAYYVDKAQAELDEKFAAEFKKEFDAKFPEEFAARFRAEFDLTFRQGFDAEFEKGVLQQLLAQGLDAATAEAMLPAAVTQAKESGAYRSAYDQAYPAAYRQAYDAAYGKAYTAAYDEAYAEAYQKATEELQSKIDEKYAEAEEKYKLNDPDFQPAPVTLYENFFRNETEDHNNDGQTDGTVRVFPQTQDINLACLMDGRFPQQPDEIAIDRMHADNVGLQVGGTITVGGESYKVVGLLAYVNYATLHEKSTDLMFDALQFNVAMVTQEGFARLHESVHYAYAWQYLTPPAGEKAEKTASDNFLRALLTQTVTAENELEDYVPRYANQAIQFALDDIGSDEAMGGVLLDILTVIIAFIFAVTISNTIAKESSAIGTLRASGYTRGELTRHYLAMPVIVTLAAAIVGNVLGYTLFKQVVVGMYYNSYSLPTYQTVWNPQAFVKTTVIPVVLMFAVNLLIITRMMRHTPLQFLRQDLKKIRRKKAVRLPAWGFFSRFRLRIMLQNVSSYLILLAGVFFISVMLAMAVGMPSTLRYYQDNSRDLMFAKYQYVLKSYEDEDGAPVSTAAEGAEKFAMETLLHKSDAIDEEVLVYGVEPNSRYVRCGGLSQLADGQVYISASFADKYRLQAGDSITLDEKYESRQYAFTVAGIYDGTQSIAVFMPMDAYRQTFDTDADAFSGFFSDAELTDVPKDNVAAVITAADIQKVCNQLDHSMGSYMTYYQYLCVLLAAGLIYLLTKLIIEKNETAISMVKILGYRDGEIGRLYLLSTSMVLVLIDAVSVFLGVAAMRLAWRVIMATYSGWFAFRMEPVGYVKMFVFVLIGYLLVLGLDFRRIRKIPMEQALKNVE